MINLISRILLVHSVFFVLVPIHTFAEENPMFPPSEYHINITPWDEAKKVIPNKKKFTVIDVETGLRFKVQRRAGSRHADVQPLTYKDTKIMKKIYGGKWSWKRRAVLLLVDRHLIAASMNGMPHGAGALKNGFPGHFCIHFKGSSTHKSRTVDFSHNLMIEKAAGQLGKYVNSLTPEDVIKTFAAGINQRDLSVAEQALLDGTPVKTYNLFKRVTALQSQIMIPLDKEEVDESLLLELPVEFTFFLNGKKEKHQIEVWVVRYDISDPWKLDGRQLYREFNTVLKSKKADE